MVKPFLKWLGSKRSMIAQITPYLPQSIKTYYEPFLGSGALFFHLQPESAVLSDLNSDLTNTYIQLRDNLDDLVTELSALKTQHLALQQSNRKNNYLQRRAEYNTLRANNPRKAALLVFLNKTCFNGLFRVNRKGEFNVPMGNYRKPKIFELATLIDCHRALQNAEVVTRSFEQISIGLVEPGDFFYLDPPYFPTSETARFTNYSQGGFNVESQYRLAAFCDDLDCLDISFLQSNSDTEWARSTYNRFNLVRVTRSGTMNSNPQARGRVSELLIYN